MTAKAQFCWQRHLGDLQRRRFWHYEICSKSPRWTGTEPWFGHRCGWRSIMVGLGSLHRTFIGRCEATEQKRPFIIEDLGQLQLMPTTTAATATTTTATTTTTTTTTTTGRTTGRTTTPTTTDTICLNLFISFWDLTVKDSESSWWPDRSVLGNVCPAQCGQRERHSWRASHWTFKWLGHRTSK